MRGENVVRKSQDELIQLLTALGHTFKVRTYTKHEGMCWSCDCEKCGSEWFLRFFKDPSAPGAKNKASFPRLGGRCTEEDRVWEDAIQHSTKKRLGDLRLLQP